MDLLDNVPTWDDVERNLDRKLRQLDHGVKSTWQSAQDGWIGVSRHVSEGASGSTAMWAVTASMPHAGRCRAPFATERIIYVNNMHVDQFDVSL